MDHCLPWSAWLCGDFWNLLPADWRVNEHGKRDRLPSADTLRATRDAITARQRLAHLQPGDAISPGRSIAEVRASLPGLDLGGACYPDDVQAVVGLQRMCLRQEQGVLGWSWRP